LLSKAPNERQSAILQSTFEKSLARFDADLKSANAFLKQGESSVNPKLGVPELAAYTTVASLMLNMDEAITKQ